MAAAHVPADPPPEQPAARPDTLALVAWLEGEGEIPLEPWRHRLVGGRQAAVPFGRRPELAEQLEMLAAGFVGECALVWLHAALNVALRRGLQPPRNARRLLDLWAGHADLLLELLDARWLISACDSFADHHPDPAQAALAASASFLVNTAKLYETERLATAPPQGGAPFPAAVPFQEIFDGLTTFLPERGDMVANLVDRLDACTARAIRSDTAPSLVAAILRELVSRLLVQPSVFSRARSAARFSWPLALAPLTPPLMPAPPGPPGDDAPGWLLLNDSGRRARGFHLGRLATAQALRDGLARRGLRALGEINDGAALEAQLASAPGAVQLLVLNAAGLRPDGPRGRALLAACLQARRAGLATVVIQAGALWHDWEPFERAFLVDGGNGDSVPAQLAPAQAEDPALLLFRDLLAAIPATTVRPHPVAVIDSPDRELAASLQRFAQATAAPLRTMGAPALERLRRQGAPAQAGSPVAWPRLLRLPDLALAGQWLGDRSGALLAALAADVAVAVPAGATDAALALLRRFGLVELALLPPEWAWLALDDQRRLLHERALAWDQGHRAALAERREQACRRIAAMLDSLAALARASCR
ncbi:MAG: hypothetical protein VKJ05_01780 [Synechococcaceae cyanobacterium]|nr:hypothetical protein [Synechococcaceae cyanobacterium]